VTRSLRERLDDLALACAKCADLVSRSEAVVLSDEDLVDALAYRLITVGEATGALRRDFPDIPTRHPQIPWKELVGLRDIVVHQYFRMSPVILWATARDDIPPLARVVTQEIGRANA
jgi:uncharacterized protein with HEPN domain